MRDGLFVFAFDPYMYWSAALVTVVVLVAVVLLSPAARFVIAGALSVPLFFVPGLPVSLGQPWFLAIGAVAVLDRRVRPRPEAPLVLIWAFLGLQVVAIAWSPDPDLAVAECTRAAMFAVLCWYAFALARSDPRALDRALVWTTPWVILESVLVVVFRLDPASEEAFLRSTAADLLVGPFARALFDGERNNVLDPAKAGGLFVNGNVASMFCGIAAFVMVILWCRTGRAVFLPVALCAWVAVFFTGSKTGAALAVAMPLVAVLLTRVRDSPALRPVATVLVVSVPLTLGPLDSVVSGLFPSYSENSADSLGTREQLWDAAATMFRAQPVFGLGFGGWEERIASYVGRDDYPPHNLVIHAWSTAGAAAALVVVLLLVVIVVRFVRAALDPRATRTALAVNACACAAWLWVVIHGMGDNTQIYGEWKSMFVVAALLGYQVWVRADADRGGAPCAVRERAAGREDSRADH